MRPSINTTNDLLADPLDQYVASIHTMNRHIDRIVAAKNDVAGSLSRAAALRSIAAVQVRRPPGSDKAAR
ncbi:hypothetical protein [Azonexus sp.]|uniref:hypothetical protein n=1 Tax=Azonexus sp. TaxID=1872668 RepID=UPI0035AE5824